MELSAYVRKVSNKYSELSSQVSIKKQAKE